MDNRNFITDNALLNVIKAHAGTPARNFNRRDFVEPLINFCLDDDYSAKIGIVYGLRSTGKTVGMLQAAGELLNQGYKVAYARFNYNETGMKDANTEMLQLANEGFTHFFVDEASYLSGFLNNSAEWADMFVPRNRVKIVISGTDSFLIWTAQRKSLFHRYVQFPTNWNSFPEYARVMELPYDNYKREGGIFTDESIPDFIQSAVVDNLLHTIEHCIDDAGRTTFYTDYLYGINETVIYKAIISILKCVAEDSLKKHFVENAGKKNISDLGEAISGLTTAEKRDIKERVAESMDLYRDFTPIDKPRDVIGALIEFLVRIGCLIKYTSGKNEFADKDALAFTHNALMSFAAEETIRGLRKVENINQSVFDESVRQTVEGVLNENVVLAHILQAAKNGVEVFKYRDADNREIDTVIINREARTLCLIEVKSKSNINAEHLSKNEARHLLDDAVMQAIGIDDEYAVTRVIAYRGKSDFVLSNDNIVLLVNIEDLLMNCNDLSVYLDKMKVAAEKSTKRTRTEPQSKKLLEKLQANIEKAKEQPSKPKKKTKGKSEIGD